MSTLELRRWTRDEYDRMIAAGILLTDDRVELLEGEILTMSPQGSHHAVAIGLIGEAFKAVFGAGSWVRFQLPLALTSWSEPEPDVAVVPGSPRDYRDAHPQSALLVIEVADDSLQRDRRRKGSLYARAGIAEYWILNLAGQQLEAYRNPGPTAGAVTPLAAPRARIAIADLLP